ncbi:hypothetical protein C8J57DRAFT_1634439 [Mycena rebaudengoi]|nr:hypothetical protein C8J57DRAFT_1634439 [Mycena rebaudengoi]
MIATLGRFTVVLQLYFLEEFSLQRVFYILSVLVATYPLFRLHLNQRREPRQLRETAWLRSITDIFVAAFDQAHEHPDFPPNDSDIGPQLSQRVLQDLEQLYGLLGIPDESTQLFPEPHTILSTHRIDCIFCPNEGHPRTLRRHRKPQQVRLLNSKFHWVTAQLFVAYCGRCKAEFYPDRITFHLDETSARRVQRPEYDAAFIRVSKHGIWMDRRIALCQENAILRFHSGWSNFADWLSDTIDAPPRITTRQSQRLYFEHFARRLIVAHGLQEEFSVPAHSSSHVFAESVRNIIGRDGGVVAGAMDHGCTNCTHVKRYASDLVADGAVLDGPDTGVVGAAEPFTEEGEHNLPEGQIPSGLSVPPKQQERIAGAPRGYARLAVMDGKTITHRICAISTCTNGLVNFKNGRFCHAHLDMRTICGIIPCGRPVRSNDAVTCDNQSHKDWHTKYLNRFSCQSFPGVQRVIRRQMAAASEGNTIPTAPALHVELPELQGVAGADVAHTFRARTTYCLQTVQWSCGCPIGWGKCYRSESSPQVLQILDNIWDTYPDSKPSFVAYDDACNLLRHIVTQDPSSSWLSSTKFIVDAWHYIGHRAGHVLCRVWCNPAPTNGSQPDLISVHVDENGRTHTTRAFNTEMAEQLNAWLTGFEAQLRQMSDTNYDFVVHVLMLLYMDLVEKRVAKKDEELTAEFWEKVEGTD